MKIIIAVAGPKGIGKTSLCKYIQFSHELKKGNLQYCNGDGVQINAELVQFPDTGRTKVFSLKDAEFHPLNLPHKADAAIFSFASKVKSIATDVLGMSRDGVFGSEINKNDFTYFSWDRMPIWIRWINSPSRSVSSLDAIYGIETTEIKNISYEKDLWLFCSSCRGMPSGLRTGSMSNREVMQILGTDIFRNMFDKNVWVNCTLSDIVKSECSLCLIDDMRFDTEANAVLNHGGYIINLFRDFNGADIHESEKGLCDPAILNNDRVFHVKSGSDIMTKNKTVSIIVDEIINKKERANVSVG